MFIVMKYNLLQVWSLFTSTQTKALYLKLVALRAE
jgi:hypothetical protein